MWIEVVWWMMSMLEKYNNLIFSHAHIYVLVQNGNIKKANVSRPYPNFLYLYFFFTPVIWLQIQCAHVDIEVASMLLVHTHRTKKSRRSARVQHRKMSQEIKTPSIVNLHNELCRCAHDSHPIHILSSNSDKDQYLTVESCEKKNTYTKALQTWYCAVVIITHTHQMVVINNMCRCCAHVFICSSKDSCLI